MSNNTKYLSYEGLSHYTEKLKGYFADKEHNHDYLPLSGGTLTGDLVLKHSSDGDTPKLVFQRGEISSNLNKDTYIDYDIYNTEGKLTVSSHDKDSNSVQRKSTLFTFNRDKSTYNFYASFKTSITLDAPTENSDTPALIFKRGTFTDGWYDHKIYNSGGALKFQYSNAGTDIDILSLANTTSKLSSGLTLTGETSETARISFSRGSDTATNYNYITAPVGGNIVIAPHGINTNSETGYHFAGTCLYPGKTNTYSLGTETLKWKNVYATKFIGTLEGTASKVSNTLTIQKNGTTIDSYDGSAAKTVNIVTNTLNGTTRITDATKRSLLSHPTTTNVSAGYWGSESGTLGFNTRYGTTLDISYSTWYQRLAFDTSESNGKQRIEYFSGINTNNSGGTEATLTKIGDLAYTSDIPTKVSQLTNDAGYTTASGHTHSYIPLSEKVNATAVSHTNYSTNGTYVPTMNFLSYWNGAYNSGNSSNLTYCKHGAFGTIVTKNAGDYATAGHTHSYVPTKTVTFTPAETAIGPAEVLSKLGSGPALGKGTWDYAGNGYISKDTTGSIAIDLAGCSVIQFGGSSAYTQLYITAPANTTTNAKSNEILFYNNHGSSYSPAWTRVLTNRNYSEYCATKTHTHDTLTPNEIDDMFEDEFGIKF